jgi:hypothetical protein
MMADYYRLDIDYAAMRCRLADDSRSDTANLFRGLPFPETEKPDYSFILEIEEEPEDGTDKNEGKGRQDPLLFSYFPSVSVTESRLVDTLRAAGVDNLQAFAAPIEHRRQNTTIGGYVALNVIGLVSCANLEESSTSKLADGYYFHELVLDRAKASSLLMFRLAESPTEIILHKKVAKAIEDARFTGLVTIPVKTV